MTGYRPVTKWRHCKVVIMLTPIHSQAVVSIRKGMDNIALQAHRLASQNTSPSGIDTFSNVLVETKLSEVQIAAAVKLLKAADASVGSLINLKA